jgi:hypothetical protein
MNEPKLLEGYISEEEWCKQFGICKKTARNMRDRGNAPPYIEFARQIIYSVSGTREWLASREKKPVRARRTAWIVAASETAKRHTDLSGAAPGKFEQLSGQLCNQNIVERRRIQQQPLVFGEVSRWSAAAAFRIVAEA